MHLICVVKKIINYLTPKDNSIVLIPHIGIYIGNKGSLNNYASDNVLTFTNYLLENTEPGKYKFYLASGDEEIIDKEINICSQKFPLHNVVPFNYFEQNKLRGVSRIKNTIKVLKIFSHSKLFFIASPNCFDYKIKKQKVVCLSYYSTPFKNDYFEPKKGDVVTLNYRELARGIDVFCTNSMLASQINAISTGLSISKFHSVGLCRNDNFSKVVNERIRIDIISRVNYPVNKVLLYTPTHRDYEKSEFDITRSILGFDIDSAKFSNFLKENSLLILCKLHPKQNKLIVNKSLPEGVINFIPCDNYGLTELMQISDILITDYTSAYFDYLLLDKPVMFNFYDYETYKKIRGFSYDPLHPFLAGEIFNDENSFYGAVMEALTNDKYKSERLYVNSIVNKWESGACKRTYKLLKNYFPNGKQ